MRWRCPARRQNTNGSLTNHVSIYHAVPKDLYVELQGLVYFILCNMLRIY